MKSSNAPQPPLDNACRLKPNGFGLFPFRSPLLGEYLRFLFLRVLRCFTSPGLASMAYEFSHGSYGITRKGLPHSEISGSKSACNSPKRIAACRVLHRLLTPSHPPQALRSLTLCLSISLTMLIFLEKDSTVKIYVLPIMKLSKNRKIVLIGPHSTH